MFRPSRFTLLIALAASPAFAQVNIEIFQNYVDHGNGISFSNPVGSFTSPNINFVIGAGGSWHPFGLASFGARITGNLYGGSVTQHTHDMGISSSDGSYLFFNGDLLINNGGIHGFSNVQSPFHDRLPGANPFELQFFKSSDGGASGVEMTQYFQSGGALTMFPAFFTAPLPEPTTLLIASVGAIELAARRRRPR